MPAASIFAVLPVIETFSGDLLTSHFTHLHPYA
jgi:hypothetical protein